MKTVLFLDDDHSRIRKFRSAYPSAKIVETAADAIFALEHSKYDFVFLDHDLNEEVYVDSSRDDCGMAVVRWMIKNKPDCEVFVHTCNRAAGDEMDRLLSKSGYKTNRTLFVRIELDSLFDDLQS